MTLNEKIAKIVKSLRQKTDAGEIQWDSTIEDGFITSRPDSSIVIDQIHNVYRSPETVHRIILSDSNGKQLAVLDETELPEPQDLVDLYDRVSSSKAEELADAWLQ